VRRRKPNRRAWAGTACIVTGTSLVLGLWWLAPGVRATDDLGGFNDRGFAVSGTRADGPGAGQSTFTIDFSGTEDAGYVLIAACRNDAAVVHSRGPENQAPTSAQPASDHPTGHRGMKFEPGPRGRYSVTYDRAVGFVEFIVKNGNGHKHFKVGSADCLPAGAGSDTSSTTTTTTVPSSTTSSSTTSSSTTTEPPTTTTTEPPTTTTSSSTTTTTEPGGGIDLLPDVDPSSTTSSSTSSTTTTEPSSSTTSTSSPPSTTSPTEPSRATTGTGPPAPTGPGGSAGSHPATGGGNFDVQGTTLGDGAGAERTGLATTGAASGWLAVNG
jgi:hypothetical protein